VARDLGAEDRVHGSPARLAMFTRSATLPFESVARMNFRLEAPRGPGTVSMPRVEPVPGTVQVVDLLLGEPDDAN